MEKSLRIVFLSEHASPLALLGGADAGGQNVYVDEVSRNLARLGHTVDVFTRRDDPDQPEMVEWASGVRVVHLTAGPARFLPKDELWPFMPAFRDALLAFVAREGVRYDVIHGNFWMSGWVAVEAGRALDVPTVQIFHAMGKTKRRHQGDADTSPNGRIMTEHEIIGKVDRLIAQCPAECDELVLDYGANPEKVVIIPSAVNVTTFRPVPRDEARGRIGLPHLDGPVVVYVGRMLPRKDVRNVVRGLAVLARRYARWDAENATPARLLLVGGETMQPDPRATPEIGELLRLAAELRIADRVLIVGKRQPEELRNYYCAGDVVVTTPWYEPFGLTPLEGQACGRPVIGSAVGGIRSTIQDGVTGFLVPPRDPDALAERLHYLLSQSELRERMGRAARARVEREFTWPMVARRTGDLYTHLTSSRMPAEFTLEAPLVAPAAWMPNSESIGV